MGPLIARAIMWLVFGYLLATIINEFKLFNVPVRWYVVMVPVMLLFGLQEAVLKRLEIKRKTLSDADIQETKTFKLLYIPVWIFVICLLHSIPVVWWGVIRKTAGVGDRWNWLAPLSK